MQMTALVQKYIRFSHFIDEIKFCHALNCQEWDILLIIASAELNNKILKVNDLLAMDHIASPATIHKCIKLLISKKLVCFKNNSQDARVKFLHPTAKGMSLLQEISKKM
jgi:DNA-binding MarR family transcriptional regulator